MDDHLEISVDRDKMAAYLTVLPECDLEQLSFQDVLDYLHGKGIVYGIDEEAIRKILEELNWCETVKVAQGRKAVRGKDGYVEFFFETEKKSVPKINEDGSVDHHDLTLVENVMRDQELARITPPTEGKHGENIFGKTIVAAKGKAVPLVAGKNTDYADEAKTIVKAAVNGYAMLKRSGVVEVDTVYTVHHDVDYSTGDLQIYGDVCVRGNVKAGFKIKASDNVEVRGLLEDAEIIAGGNVKVTGGFVGKGKGLIRSDGDVQLGFIHNQRVIAHGDVTINKSAIQAEITAGGSLTINRGKGKLLGGITRVTKYAEIDEIGNDQYIKTTLIVGHTERMDNEVEKVNEEIEQCADNIARIKKKVMSMSMYGKLNKWTKETGKLYLKLVNLLIMLSNSHKELMERKIGLINEIEGIRRKSYVKINRRVYPGVRLKVAGFTKKFDREWTSSTFRVVNGELVSGFH